jgi:hypothetical protein
MALFYTIEILQTVSSDLSFAALQKRRIHRNTGHLQFEEIEKCVVIARIDKIVWLLCVKYTFYIHMRLSHSILNE